MTYSGGVGAERDVFARFGPSPKQANVPPSGLELKTAGWMKCTVWPSKNAVSTRGWAAATAPPNRVAAMAADAAARANRWMLMSVPPCPCSPTVAPGGACDLGKVIDPTEFGRIQRLIAQSLAFLSGASGRGQPQALDLTVAIAEPLEDRKGIRGHGRGQLALTVEPGDRRQLDEDPGDPSGPAGDADRNETFLQ